VHSDADEYVFGTRFGIFDENVEVAVVLEDPRIEEFVFELLARPPTVRLDQITIRKLALRLLVEELHVGVGRSAIDIEVVLLDVLAVVALAVCEAEQTFFQDGISFVP